MRTYWRNINLIFLTLIIVNIVCMSAQRFSDDQITYIFFADSHFGLNAFQNYWGPDQTFAYLLGVLRAVTGDYRIAFMGIFGIVSLLYLNAITWCFSYFFKSKRVAVSLAIISWVPRYTLAMTYWGFAGFEYIRGRILIMPLVAIILRLYFENLSKRKVWIPLALCVVGGFLHLEIFYLLLILVLHQAFFHISKRDYTKLWVHIRTSAVLGACAFGIQYLRPLAQKLSVDANTSVSIESLYTTMIRANHTALSQMPTAEYMEFFWEAAYAAFWWTLFPPRFLDLSFALINAGFLIPFVLMGFLIQKKRNKQLFQGTVVFMIICLALAYGYQILRYLGWKSFNFPPDIWEEVRAIKFLYFPLFLYVGTFLTWALKEKRQRLFWVAVCLMCLSPLGVLRALPLSAKQHLQQSISPHVPESAQGYLAKVVQIPSEANEDLEHILKFLKEKPAPVLSDLHALKRAGHQAMVSYQDKRIGPFEVDGRIYDSLPHWYFTYLEVSLALRSGKAQQLYTLASKYGCRYIVSPKPLDDWRLGLRYAGKRYFLYELVN